jgi:hypothetical protein
LNRRKEECGRGTRQLSKAGRFNPGFGDGLIPSFLPQDLGDSNYSEFFGYGGSLFNNTPYEQASTSSIY